MPLGLRYATVTYCHTESSMTKELDLFKSAVAGTAGGVSAVLVGHPLDTVKTSMYI